MHNLLIAKRLNLIPKSNPGSILKVCVALYIFFYSKIAFVLYSGTLLVNKRRIQSMKFDQMMYRGAFVFSMFTDKMIIINVCFLFLTNICIQSSC